MNVLRRFFGGPSTPPDHALHLYVRCSHCASVVHVRVHLLNDLTVEFGDSEEVVGYHLRKEMMDARCFRLMYADIAFDRSRRELSRTLEGGEFITKEEYERLAKPAPGAP